MKRLKVSGLIDLFKVNDPNEIQAVVRDLNLDRKFETKTCPINSYLLRRSLMVLSFGGRRFPTMTPREDAQRAQQQEQLWNQLSAKATAIVNGPEELESLANWIRGVGSDEALGVLVQQLLGQLFSDEFVATQESWEAAKILVAAPRSNNLFNMGWWSASGKVRRAKRLLAGMVNDDLSAVNAIGIAAHNVVKSFRRMRVLHADAAMRETLSAEAAAEQCLFAPVSVYRQATESGRVNGWPTRFVDVSALWAARI